MQRILMLVLAAGILAGCAIPAEKVGLRGFGPKPTWDMQASATSGAALVQRTASGDEALRIACRRNPSDLYVAAAGLPAQSGPLALQVGERRFDLAGEGRGPQLSATGPWPDALPAALMSGATVRVALGRQTWAFAAPEARTAAAFAIARRGAVR